MARLHQTHVVPSCLRRASERDGVETSSRTPVPTPHNIPFPFNPKYISPPQNSDVLEYALGTLEYRKQRNRKRTKTGEYVWTDEADLVFALALIDWTSKRSNRVGKRRANFLQQFLSRNGFTKTRKQIASRLQVLRGEWRATPYLTLLEDPDCPENKRCCISCAFPSTCSEKFHDNQSPPSLSTPSPTSARSFLPEDEFDPTLSEREFPEGFVFPPLSVQDHRHTLGSFVEVPPHGQHCQVPDPLTRPEATYQTTGHQLHMHAPRAVAPSTLLQSPWPLQVPNTANVPSFPPQTLSANPYTSCGPPVSDTPLDELSRRTHSFTC